MRSLTYTIILLFSLLCSCEQASSKEGEYINTGESSNADQNNSTDTDNLKVLFIGNSLTLDATYLLPSLLNAAGIKNIELTRTFHGAYTLPLYNDNYANNNICSFSTWKPGQARWRGEETRSFSPKAVVEADKYDIVCLQEYTGNSCCWTWTNSEKEHITSLISKIKASQAPNSPEFVFLFSSQFGRGMERLVENFGNDPVKQFEANVETISQILAETGIKKVISTGALQQNLRTTGLNTDRDMTRGDQTHLDYGHMRYAASCLIFKSLFTPICGIKPEDIPYSFEEYYPYPTLHTTPVTAENKPVLFAAIQAAYDNPMQITDLSRYTSSPSYKHKPGSVFLDENSDIEAVSFPVEFPLGNAVNDAYIQPYWTGYGIWVSRTQPQAYVKLNFASYPFTNIFPKRSFANNGTISSPMVNGLWTGDWFEFVIPVKALSAGAKIRFSAPFYTRQGPVFWAFEWLDGDTWKDDCTDMTVDGFTRKASFALKAGSNSISRTATFEKAVPEGKLHFRIRCVDGTIQADSATLKAVERSLPNHSDSEYSSVFYFYGSGANDHAISFNIEK